MGEQERRADEEGALDAVCAVEDVACYEWLRESQIPNVRTPDLRVTLRDGVQVTVEIIMATLEPANRLFAAARKMRPKRFHRLSLEWTVFVSDHDIQERSPSRSLKELVAAMVPVLAEAEALGASPQAMRNRAQTALDPDPYDPNRWTGIWRIWMEAQPWEGTFDEWVSARLADHCSYWYPPDIADLWTHDLAPRRVNVAGTPAPPEGRSGGIHVYVSTGTESLYRRGSGRPCISGCKRLSTRKRDAARWRMFPARSGLLYRLDGNNAAVQLEGAFGPSARLPRPDFSVVQFSGFDQVWVIAKTFDGNYFIVLRLFHNGNTLVSIPLTDLNSHPW